MYARCGAVQFSETQSTQRQQISPCVVLSEHVQHPVHSTSRDASLLYWQVHTVCLAEIPPLMFDLHVPPPKLLLQAHPIMSTQNDCLQLAVMVSKCSRVHLFL